MLELLTLSSKEENVKILSSPVISQYSKEHCFVLKFPRVLCFYFNIRRIKMKKSWEYWWNGVDEVNLC